MAIYERHRPESTVLYQSVARAWPKIEIEYAINDQSIPPHVTAEFERYTRCGILDHGFARLYCKDCLAERVIGFSCKGRGFCPACGSRRALQKADRIEREVWPRVKAPSPSPVRQSWVLTFPHQFRAWLLRSPELFNEVIAVVIDSISFFYEQHSAFVIGKDHIYLPTAGSASCAEGDVVYSSYGRYRTHGPLSPGTYYYRVCAQNAVGLTSIGVTTTYTLAPIDVSPGAG